MNFNEKMFSELVYNISELMSSLYTITLDLYRTVSYRIVSYCIVLYRTVLYCIVLYCIVLLVGYGVCHALKE